MKTKNLILVAAFCSFSSQIPSASAQGTAFTYQGRLNDGPNSANGSYDFRFVLYDNGAGGSQQGPILTNSATAVTNGLFTATLDFGNQFPGAARWLEIAVRTNGNGSFNTLSPRQPLTPTPYAITAGAVVSGGIPAGTYGNAVTFNNAANSFTGNFAGNGGAVTNVNAATLGGLGANQFWKINGNSNTVAGVNYLGTPDNRPLELRAGGLRVLRLEPDSRGDIAGNLIGGATNNAIAQPGSGGSVIGGGGYLYGPNLIHSNSSGVFIGAGSGNQIGPQVGDAFIGGGFENRILPPGFRAVIVGGTGNTNSGYLSIIVGGSHNWINGAAEESFIGGGSENQIVGSATDMVAGTIGGGSFNHIFTNGTLGTIGGGFNNNIQAETDGGTIGGGYNGSVAGDYATIPGGTDNWANGLASFAAGRRAKAVHDGAFVWADSQDADFNSTATNQFSVRAKGGARFETGGAGLKVDGQSIATTNAALLNVSQTFSGQNTFNNTVNVNASLTVNTVTPPPPASTLTIAGDLSLSGGATTYHKLSMTGGNSAGFLYGSFPALGDGIHLGYNYYADSAGGNHVINAGGGTSRVSAGYGQVVIAVGGVNSAPSGVRVDATLAGVSVYGTFNNFSDRNAKQDFAPVNSSQILAKVLRLPLSEWSYKEDSTTRHIGPMAQDFYSIFNIGTDDRHIAPVDEGGVALAAIQGLNEKVEAKNAEIAELKRELENLKQVVNRLVQANN